MGILTDELAEQMPDAELSFVAALNADGTPNLPPKVSLAIYDSEHPYLRRHCLAGYSRETETRPSSGDQPQWARGLK